ncbi:hypothetical protein NECAME_09592 [Necator americanus]|uniref:Uncharacterized protein n=1 Tax=Necator americanus TaxID=51031 RepID=W2TFQ7_NECAM|nr:hypothetical protein NECAME_09592 [Necator americanus]ETN79837.1 hypothetical protein NECAME_09592 [Necator americanus]
MRRAPVPPTTCEASKAVTCAYASYSTTADPLARFKALASATSERPRVLITGSLGQLGRGLNTVYKWASYSYI